MLTSLFSLFCVTGEFYIQVLTPRMSHFLLFRCPSSLINPLPGLSDHAAGIFSYQLQPVFFFSY